MTISDHARARLADRTSFDPEQLEEAMARYVVPLAHDTLHRTRYLFWSEVDRTWFIIVQAADGAIVTVMPYDYKARTVGAEALDMARQLHRVAPVRPATASRSVTVSLALSFRLGGARRLGKTQIPLPWELPRTRTDPVLLAWVAAQLVQQDLLPLCKQDPLAKVVVHRGPASLSLGSVGDLLPATLT